MHEGGYKMYTVISGFKIFIKLVSKCLVHRNRMTL